MSTIRKYQTVASINNVAQPIKGFKFSSPNNALNARAEVSFADPTITVEKGDEFDLVLQIPSGAVPKSRLIKNGFVVGTSQGIASRRLEGFSVPNDSLSLTALDKIGEKYKLAPRIPQILFDPQYLNLDENETDTNINDEDGNRIYAEITAVNYLDLEALLEFAYVESIGFDEVIHNIPNYRIPRVDFPLNSAYHAVAAPFYAMFRPLVFEDDNRLFIIDVFGEIPAGVLSGARSVQLSKLIRYDFEKPESPIVNAVLLSHKEIARASGLEDELPPNATFRTEEDEQHAGVENTPGWQRTTYTRFIAEIHDDEDDPGKITAEVVYKTETRTYGYDESGVKRDLTIETQEDRYSNSWRLKIGYTKTVEAWVEDGEGSAIYQTVLTERNDIQWKPSIINPGEWEKKNSRTVCEGLVLVDGGFTVDEAGNAIFEEETVAIPLLEASRNKEIPSDGSLDIVQLPIWSSIEVWRYTGADQIEVHYQKIDQLSKRLQSNKTVEHVGTNAVRVRTGDTFNTKQVLLIDEDSDTEDGPREPISFDAGFVPYAIAKELALRELENVREPKPSLRCQLATYDAGIRRGSVRNVYDRDGNFKTVIVTGFDVDGTPVERGMLQISQIIDGIVIDQ